MQINWRQVKHTNNSFAALYASCEQAGYILSSVDSPADDITLYSLNSINAETLLSEMKGANCITIAGGPHASARYQEVAKVADYVVIGEGEYTLPHLLRAIETDSKTLPPGVATQQHYQPTNNSVLLDAYPPFTKIRGYIEISRGCPHHCGYCQTPCLFGRQMRHRSIDAILRAASCYRDVRFVTPNAFSYGSDGRHPRFDKLEKLLEKLKGGEHSIFLGTFPSEVRPEWISEQSLDLISKYCTNTKMHFGAQSGSNRVLRQLRRGHTTETTIQAIECCKDNGFTPIVDYIVGLPMEEKEDQLETVEQMKWVTRFGKIHAHYFTPLPGTPLENSTPVPLIPEVTKTLGQLSLAGKATGSWMDTYKRFSSLPQKEK